MKISRRGFLSLLGLLPVIGTQLPYLGTKQVAELHGSEFVLVRGWLLRKDDLLEDRSV